MSVLVPKRIVIGIGNPERGDDAVGRSVLAQLRGSLPASIALAEENGEAGALLARLAGIEAAYLIDAAVSGAPPGTIHRVDVAASALPPAIAGFSTHSFGLAEAIELARALGRLPPRCVVYAIEAASFAPRAPLSPAVAAALPEVAARLRAEFADLTGEE